MKKIVILFTISTILLITGCNNKKDINNDVETAKEEVPVKEETIIDTYEDDNPIKLGLYIGINNISTLVDTYESSWSPYNDIIVFTTFYTQDKTLPLAYVANNFDTYKNKYTNIDDYRIGYNIKFTTNTGDVIDKTILNINDSKIDGGYISLYIYDDLYHRNDSWYSHIEANEWNESTMMTSLKITAESNINNINSLIEVETFTYNSDDDFDKNGKYRGNSTYTAYLKHI